MKTRNVPWWFDAFMGFLTLALLGAGCWGTVS